MFHLFTNVIVFMAERVMLVVVHFLTCGCHRAVPVTSVIRGSVVPHCKGFSLLVLVLGVQLVQLPDVGGADPSPCT